MKEINQSALAIIERSITASHREYDLPNDQLSNNNDNEETPASTNDDQHTFRSRVPPRFPYVRMNALTGTIRAHAQIYVVNEQIIHGQSTWSNSLSAFDNLQSANANARSRAIPACKG